MTLHPVGAISSAANPLVSIVWFGKNRLQWVEKEVSPQMPLSSLLAPHLCNMSIEYGFGDSDHFARRLEGEYRVLKRDVATR